MSLLVRFYVLAVVILLSGGLAGLSAYLAFDGKVWRSVAAMAACLAIGIGAMGWFIFG